MSESRPDEANPAMGAGSGAPDPASAVPTAPDHLAEGERTLGTETPPAPAIETPAAAPEIVPTETPAGLKPHTDEPGILRLAEEAKESEAAAPEGEKPAEPTEPAAEAIKYEWKFPDGVEIQAERLEKFENFSREQKFTPELAQSLMEMHTDAMQAYDAVTLQRQHDQFGETRKGWRQRTMADPELGGAGFETVQKQSIRGLLTVTPEQYRTALDEALLTTGMCDHPEFVRLGYHIYKMFSAPAPVPAQTPSEPIPGAAGTPPSRAGSRLNYTHSRGGRRAE